MQLCIGFNPYKLIPLTMLCLDRDMPCEANITITRQRVWFSSEAGFSLYGGRESHSGADIESK